jgi:integrase
MLATGVRIGEALAVSWDDVDLKAGRVEIDHTLVRIKGVGLIRKGTKSKAGERTLRLPEFALTMMRRRKLAAGGRGPVFPEAWVTSHVFRKTAATEMDAAGLSARQIADQLGHAKVSMTQDNYFGRKVAQAGAAQVLSIFDRNSVVPKSGDKPGTDLDAESRSGC